MQGVKDLIGKQVISITDGRRLGIVRDLYLDGALQSVSGIYVGAEGLLNRKPLLIARSDVMVFGIDAFLAESSDVVKEGIKGTEAAKWVRRDKLQGWQVMTSGGTKVGTIDDVLLSDDMRVIGFALGRTFVEGPVAENRAISREAMIQLDLEEDVMIIDLPKAERQTLTQKTE